MIFSSLVFLCVFLPVVFGLYCVLPSMRGRNALLILASLVFYAYGEPIYVLLMIGSALGNYLCARWIAKSRGGKKKALLVLALVLNLGVLCLFKYTAFLIGTVNSLFRLHLSVPEIVLPIGISFFTFQALSYVIDVYFEKVAAQESFWRVLLYISFFPQLIAGPIVKYRDIDEALQNRKQEPEQIARGLRRFIVGLGKKVLLANTAGRVADAIFSADLTAVNALAAWLGAVAYMLQIYYDFSGYSDMAIGLGRMFGFRFRENFNYPYAAVGIKDFWRRWHISLSGWFREYLYIPLGGNRKGKGRTCLNKLIVFFCTGLWHGANWTFVLWGLYHGLFLLLEDALPFVKKLPKFFAHAYTLLVVCVGFVLFRADTVSQGVYFIAQMFGGFRFSALSLSLVLRQLTPWFLFMLVLSVVGAAPLRPLAERIQAKLSDGNGALTAVGRLVQTGSYAASFVLLAWCMIRLSGNTYNPFIYFRF